MFFRNTEKRSVLDLNADGPSAAALTAGLSVSTQSNLSVQDKVKQYFEQFREPILHYLMGTFGGEMAQAEEVTQEAFLQLYRYLNGGHTIQNARAWTFRVAHNLAVDRLKRRQFIASVADEEWDELQASIADKEPNPRRFTFVRPHPPSTPTSRLSTTLGRRFARLCSFDQTEFG